MDEVWLALLIKDGPERPGDSNRRGEVSLRGRKGIGCCRALKEKPETVINRLQYNFGQKHLQSKEHKHLCPNAGMVVDFIDTKCLESSEDDKDRRPTMIKRERDMNKKFIRQRLRDMVFLNDVVDML
jgi:hypothetical protein